MRLRAKGVSCISRYSSFVGASATFSPGACHWKRVDIENSVSHSKRISNSSRCSVLASKRTSRNLIACEVEKERQRHGDRKIGPIRWLDCCFAYSFLFSILSPFSLSLRSLVVVLSLKFRSLSLSSFSLAVRPQTQPFARALKLVST